MTSAGVPETPSQPLNGRCMCGACTFTATPRDGHFGACHCSMCRKWSGGIYMAIDCEDTVVFDEGAPFKAFASSDWGERVFCTECGSSLVWQTRDKQTQVVSIQCFEDPSQFTFGSEIFIDDMPGAYALAGDHKRMTGAELLAQMHAGEAT